LRVLWEDFLPPPYGMVLNPLTAIGKLRIWRLRAPTFAEIVLAASPKTGTIPFAQPPPSFGRGVPSAGHPPSPFTGAPILAEILSALFSSKCAIDRLHRRVDHLLTLPVTRRSLRDDRDRPLRSRWTARLADGVRSRFPARGAPDPGRALLLAKVVGLVSVCPWWSIVTGTQERCRPGAAINWPFAAGFHEQGGLQGDRRPQASRRSSSPSPRRDVIPLRRGPSS